MNQQDFAVWLRGYFAGGGNNIEDIKAQLNALAPTYWQYPFYTTGTGMTNTYPSFTTTSATPGIGEISSDKKQLND
jgi:hypothetical protein